MSKSYRKCFWRYRKDETLPTSTSPTLPTKDYPDVIVQTPDTKKQRRKIVKLIEVQEIEKQVMPSSLTIRLTVAFFLAL